VPPLVLLSLQALRRIEIGLKNTDAIGRRTILGAGYIGAIVTFFWPNLNYVAQQFEIVRPLEFIRGEVARVDYISRYRREYPILAYANRELPESARILAFYLGNRSYYSDRIVDCRYSEFYQALDTARSPEELVEFLERSGFSHLLIRLDMFEHHLNNELDDEKGTMLLSLFQHNLRPLHRANGYALFEVLGSQDRGGRGG
jgi:hypothetical protein